MPSTATIKASNAQIPLHPTTSPQTTIFIGSTSGIGRATLTRLVALQIPIKVYLIGRNSPKNQTLVGELRVLNGKAEIVFLEAEVALLREVSRVCVEIKRREGSVDVVFLSTGYIPHGGREITSEGVDLFSALAYYGRLLFVLQLLLLLKASRNNPRVVNLGGAGNEVSNLFLEDLDLKEEGYYALWNMINTVATSMTLTLSRVAEENPDIVFIFNLPGLVPTGIHAGSMFDRWYGRILIWMIGIPVEDAGERCVFLLTSAMFGGNGVPLLDGMKGLLTMKKTEEGALFCVNQKMEGSQQEGVMSKLKSQNAGEKVWANLLEVLGPYL